MAEQFSNAMVTTLAAPAGAGDTTLTLSSNPGLPASGNFRLVLDPGPSAEIVLVTAVAGNVCTVTRAVEAVGGVQTAFAHAAGVQVALVLTAASLTALVSQAAVPAFIGQSIEWNSATDPPQGTWHDEDGSAVSRATYATLFALLGTTFGVGDGSTTFNLPDSRDRVAISTSPGSLPGNRPSGRTLGATGGEETHLLLSGESGFPGYQFSINTDTVTASGGTGWDRSSFMGGADGGDASNDITLLGSAAAAAHNTMQPFIVKRKIIRIL